MTPRASDAAESFEPLRNKLLRVAYRMLGSVADAQDIVQEAFIRWMGADRAAVLVPEAFLRRMVTRLCLDQLKSARHRRETYVGEWLPDPIVEEHEHEDVTLPLMLALERLSPLERAVFLLHDVFGVSFDEIAETVQREPSACRQVAVRARAHVRAEPRRYELERQRGLAIAAAFFAASRSGDMKTIAAMLAADVSLHADGGGKRPTLTRPVLGFDDVMKAQALLADILKSHPSTLLRVVRINGLPGFITREADGELQTTALEIDGDRIAAIYVMRNPDKLGHLH